MGENKNQHFLPQFLLKGFASRKKTKKSQGKDRTTHFVYVARRGDKFFETNTTNVGAENYFYSDVDAVVSEREPIYAAFLNELRKENEPDSWSLAPELVAHLIVRTKHLRESMSGAATSTLDTLDRVLPAVENHDKLTSMVRDELLKHDLLRSLPPHLQGAVAQLALNSLGRENLPLLFQKLLHAGLPHLDVSKVAKGAHLKALDQGPRHEKWEEGLQELQWSVVRDPGGSVVLGDLGPVAFHGDTQEFAMPIQKRAIEAMYLPISNEVVLFGGRESTPSPVDFAALNEASVELSQSFFVSSRKTSSEEGLQRRIGNRAGLIAPSDLEGVVRDLLEGSD